MAAIGNIRKHSTFLVIVIGVALAAFVLGDFAKGGGGSRNINIGEVEGEEITIMDFNSLAERNIDAVMQQQQKDRLTSDEIFTTKDQTWNEEVRRIIMDNEYDVLGLTVTSDELFDLIQGPNPHKLIKQNFVNQETKQYDRNLVIQYLQNLETMPEATKQQWVRFEKYVKEDRLRNKFNALISKGYYVPKDIAKIVYNEKNDKADIDYVAAKFADVSDSLFNPTDKDYSKYFNDNKEQFKQKASRDIEYIVFNIVPSTKDIEDSKKEIDQIAHELKETVDVVRFVKVNSDTPYDTNWFVRGTLPVQIDSIMFNSEVGIVTTPYMLDNEFHTARLMKVGYRPDSMKASHILISYEGAYNADPEIKLTRDQAVSLADSLFNVLKRKPDSMDTFAKEFSTDPSAQQNNGDLGWFKDGQMVPAFNEAVYNTKEGDFTMTETPFGFHIIEVTGKKELVKKVKVAMVDREIYASDNTYQDTFAKASKIATESENSDEFNTTVIEQRLNKRKMTSLREMSNYIAGLTNPRQIIRWAYNEDTEVGQVSSVFDLDDMFVVAVLIKKIDEGYPTVDQVKERIKPQVYNQLKGKYYADKMIEFDGNLDKIKTDMDATEKNVPTLFFSSRNLPGFTVEDNVIGNVFGMKSGTVSQPIVGNAGVFVVKVNNIAIASDVTDYTSIVKGLNADFERRVGQESPYNLLKESLDIVDNRIEFY